MCIQLQLPVFVRRRPSDKSSHSLKARKVYKILVARYHINRCTSSQMTKYSFPYHVTCLPCMISSPNLWISWKLIFKKRLSYSNLTIIGVSSCFLIKSHFTWSSTNIHMKEKKWGWCDKPKSFINPSETSVYATIWELWRSTCNIARR
jgi:hypothetical protein